MNHFLARIRIAKILDVRGLCIQHNMQMQELGKTDI